MSNYRYKYPTFPYNKIDKSGKISPVEKYTIKCLGTNPSTNTTC